MAQIKVNINKPDPPKQIIRRHKNYEGFVQTYQKLHTANGIREMFYRDKVKLSMIVVFLMLLLIFILADIDEKEQEEPKPTSTEDTSLNTQLLKQQAYYYKNTAL